MKNLNLKYLIVGAGAAGGCMGAYLHDALKDVTLIARGDTLKAIKENGLRMKTPHAEYVVPIKVCTEQEYQDQPDVVLVCVKAYDLDTIIPFLDLVCTESTLVLPILNSLNMGEIIAEKMKQKAVFLSGVAYVAVFRESPGVVRQKLPFYRVVFGPIDGQLTKVMWKVRQDMLDAGMASELIKDPVQGALRKFIRVSTSSAVQAYFNTNAGGIRDNPERLDFKIRLASEIIDIANARGTPFEDDALEDMITSAYTLPANYQTSMKNDLDAGHRVEFQTMIFDVYDFGRKLGLEMKAYGEVCRKFGYIA